MTTIQIHQTEYPSDEEIIAKEKAATAWLYAQVQIDAEKQPSWIRSQDVFAGQTR